MATNIQAAQKKMQMQGRAIVALPASKLNMRKGSLMNEKPNRKRCYNCLHRGDTFKIVGKTHLHCCHPKWEAEFENGNASPWDTLREFSDSCADFEHQITKEQP